jgi:hypothetical protein
MCSTLRKCSFAKELSEGTMDVNAISKFKLTDQDRKLALNKTQSLRAKPTQSGEDLGVQQSQPNLVKPFSERAYHLWINIAE